MDYSLPQSDFELIFENAPGLYLVLLPDFTIVAASNAYLSATMTKREEIVGRGLFDVFPDNPDDKEADGESNLRASLNRVIAKKVQDTMAVQKYDIRRHDGTFEVRYWSPINKPVLDKEGRVKYIIHRAEDVTEFVQARETELQRAKENKELRTKLEEMNLDVLKRAQEIQQLNSDLEAQVIERTNKIIAKEAQLRHMLEIMMEGVQIIDFEWRYLYLNQAAARHGQYSREQLQGSTMMEKYPGIENTDVFRVMKECMEHREPRHLENQFVYADGSSAWFELSIQPVPEGIFILSIDITERKLAEANLYKLNQELEQKVEERTRQLVALNHELESFSYSVSHDLRAPLRAIHGYAQILQEDYGVTFDDEGKRLIQIIMNNANRMAILIDDLLEFSRLGRKNLVKGNFQVKPLVESALSELYAVNDKSRISVSIGELPVAYGDMSMIRQVIVNLLSNAVKYSSAKEKVEIEIGAFPENGMQVYYVKDHGAGFDMRYYEKLFGVFQRLHGNNEFEGTGVGLAIAHRIITKHGGTIRAEGVVGEGATFYFALPVNTNGKNNENHDDLQPN